MSPQQWIKTTNAIGIISKSGRYGGGTYAHTDIAFEFASWISPEFKLYIIKDYQRLKKDESERKAIGWDEKRALSKINYHIHTDAVQKYLITDSLTEQEKGYKFLLDSPTNQQFIILEDSKMEELRKEVQFSFWEKADDTHTIVRFATSWATRMEDVQKLLSLL